MDNIEVLKDRYRSQLAPFLDFLRIRKEELSDNDWHVTVKRTARNVLASPDQYVTGLTQNNRAEVDAIIKNLFKELLEEPGEPNTQ